MLPFQGLGETWSRIAYVMLTLRDLCLWLLGVSLLTGGLLWVCTWWFGVELAGVGNAELVVP